MRTLDEHLALAKTDLDTATALLTARPIAGDRNGSAGAIVESGIGATGPSARSAGSDELQQFASAARQTGAGDVAYLLEPDLKDGHGGIRDAQSLWWAECGGLSLSAEHDNAALNECYDVLLSARVALHRATGRAGDTLRLQDQDAVAVQAGLGSADAS